MVRQYAAGLPCGRTQLTALLVILLLAVSPTSAQPGIHTLRNDLKEMETRVHRDPDGVLQALEAATVTLEKADRETRLWYLLRRAQAHNALFMYQDFEEDIDQAKALLLAGAPVELALWIQSYAGIIEIRRGELNRGVEILASVAERALEKGPSRVYVFAVQELAYTRGLLERYQESLLDLHQAYSVAVELNQMDLVAMVNDAYGSVYGYLKDYPRAFSYYQKALSEFERLGYKDHIASVILGIASTHRYSEQWDEAEEYFNRYIEFTRYAPAGNQLYDGNYGLAMTMARRGDCERALPQIRRALGYEGPDDYDAELYKQRAICQLRHGEVAEGEASLELAANILDTMPELEGTSWTLELDYINSLLELTRGNEEQAYQMLEEYHNTAITVLEKSSSDRMNILRAELESNRQDLEIALLEQETELYELQLEFYVRENEYQRYIIIVSVLLVVVILSALLITWRNNSRIKELSYRDGLSGLYNRNFIFNFLEKVISRVNMETGGLSIILLDVDNFKSINDRFGHPVGDAVIKKISAIGEASLRSRDVMGRIGGEEFLCVLPRTTASQSMQVAERFLQAISEEKFLAADAAEFSVSISIGVADYDSSIESADELYCRADQALYRAKTDGKGRIANYQADSLVAAAALS
jgi:diguanylate cyclase (GGDEF)-like protein